MTTADDAQKQSYTVLRFTQNAVDRYYTNWSGGWTDGSNTATAIPDLAITHPPNVGGWEDKTLQVDFPLGVDAWLDGLTAPWSQAPITIRSTMLLVGIGPSASQNEEVPMGRFKFLRSVRHPERQIGVGRLEFVSQKGALNLPLGIAATPRCAWTLGDKNCGATVVEETAGVARIERKIVWLRNPTDTVVVHRADSDYRYWHDGVISYEGLSLAIMEWYGGGVDPEPYAFNLRQPPPPSWLNKIVTLRPGCSKEPAICISRFNNIEFMAPLGIGIPGHGPGVESP